MDSWVVITGGGTGIGCALAKALASKGYKVLAIGRRPQPLLDLKTTCPSGTIHTLSCDIAKAEAIDKIKSAVPDGEKIKFLVQNAAVGEPAGIEDITRENFQYAMDVNVTAPLMLTQALLPRLKESGGRILHIGTGVAFNAQVGTITYGVSKMAFYRLYEQLRVELEGTGVSVGCASPDVVDTEGLWQHVALARGKQLPHVSYFDKLKAEGNIWSDTDCASFLCFLLVETDSKEFSAKEWRMDDKEHWARWKQ